MNIKFVHSRPYDMVLSESGEASDSALVNSRIKAMEIFWVKKGPKIIGYFEDYTGLSFKEENIKCYLNSSCCISDPLSIKIEKIADMKDNLIHELAHVILTQNSIGQSFGWKNLQKQYADETPITRSHLLVHSLHYLITKAVMPTRLKFIVGYSKHPSYKRSWALVLQRSPLFFIQKYLINC